MRFKVTIIAYQVITVVELMTATVCLLTAVVKLMTVTYLLTPWSRVLLEKLTSKLCC